MGAASEKVETSEVDNAGDNSDPEISAQLAKIDELMDHSSEAIQTKQEQTSPDKIEPVVVETTTVEEKEVDETDIQIQKRRSSLKMRLSSVNSTPDKGRREMELKEKTQILWMDPTEKDDQIKLAEKLDTDSQHKALSSQQQQTFDT